MTLIDSIQIEKYFEEIESALSQNIKPLNEYKDSFTKSIGAGVYFIYDKGRLCYVGESGNIFARLSDLHRTFNHSLRRHLGAALFSNHLEYEKATSKDKYCAKIESELDEYYMNNLTFSAISVSIGRKEFEEWMLNKENDYYNKRGKRNAK